MNPFVFYKTTMIRNMRGWYNVKKIIEQSSKNANVYPQINSQDLVKEISKIHKISKEEIIVGAGSDEVLQMIFNAFC